MRIRNFKMLLNKKTDAKDSYELDRVSDEKFEELPSILKANDFKMAVEYQVTDDTVKTILPIYSWLKTCPKASVYIPDRNEIDSMLSRKHSSLMARVVIDHSYNMTLITPEEQLEVTHWETDPEEIKLARKPKTVMDLFSTSHDDYAQCTYKREKITTFDGQTVDIPMTTCYTVLAKDCADESNPRFAVLAKKLSKNGDELKVKFITRKKKFELYKSNSEMVIKADGERLVEKDFEQYHIRKIEASDMTIYEIKCPHAEAVLRFDGQKIVMKISDMYMNRQCGVCGHMNNDREDDFLKNDKTQAKSVKDFHLSYMYGEDECEPETIREYEREPTKPKSRRRPDIESTDSSEARRPQRERENEKALKRQDENDNTDDSIEDERPERNPMMKTHVVEKREDVCFSVKPALGCPEGFEPTRTEETKQNVKFLCLKRKSTDAQRYLREARNDIVDIENAVGSMSEQRYIEQKIEIPSRCVKY
jgi:hypothetical protein